MFSWNKLGARTLLGFAVLAAPMVMASEHTKPISDAPQNLPTLQDFGSMDTAQKEATKTAEAKSEVQKGESQSVSSLGEQAGASQEKPESPSQLPATVK